MGTTRSVAGMVLLLEIGFSQPRRSDHMADPGLACARRANQSCAKLPTAGPRFMQSSCGGWERRQCCGPSRAGDTPLVVGVIRANCEAHHMPAAIFLPSKIRLEIVTATVIAVGKSLPRISFRRRRSLTGQARPA